MRYQKNPKIDLREEYPCPCRRKGRLSSIVLTEALGCDRCQKIFVVQPNNQSIEELSSTYPYKRIWRWNGYRWITGNNNWKNSYLPIAISLAFTSLVIVLPLLGQSSQGMIWLITLILAVILSTMLWLSWRR